MTHDGLAVAGPTAHPEALEVEVLEKQQVEAKEVEIIDRAVTLPEGIEPVCAR